MHTKNGSNLRYRLVLSGSLVLLIPLWGLAESGDPNEGTTRCIGVAEGQECPERSTAFAILAGAGECDLLTVDSEGTPNEDDACCYQVTVDCSDYEPSGCGCSDKPL